MTEWALEFSGPLALNVQTATDNARSIIALRDREGGPPAIRHAWATAGPIQWRNRGTMTLNADDDTSADQDYMRALALDPAEATALEGLVRGRCHSARDRSARVAEIVVLQRPAKLKHPTGSVKIARRNGLL